MKLYYLSESKVPSRSANSVHVMKMCQAFSHRRIDCTLFAKGDEKNKQNDIFAYYGIETKFGLELIKNLNIRFLSRISYALKTSKKIVQIGEPSYLYGRDVYSLFFARELSNKIIYEAHKLPPKKIHYYLERKLFQSKNFYRLVVISEALKQDYLQMFPFLECNRIKVAHDGADIKEGYLQRDWESQPIIKNKVGYVGHLYKGKGMELIEKILKLTDDIEFHIVGGTPEDIKYWKGKLSSHDNVVFHGYIPNGELAKIYESIDIFLAPYQNSVQAGNGGVISKWMSPLKIFEYMANEKIIIASRLPVLEEVLIDKHNCLLCDPTDAKDWLKKIIFITNNEIESSRIASNAFKDLENKYSWRKRAKDVLK